MTRPHRLAVDIGGTFTDVVLAVDGEAATTTAKLLTTHDDPAVAVEHGVRDVLARAGRQADQTRLVLHGTTLATNALIERRGARTALLTTSGHRDVLEMALENRFEQYDLNAHRPAPLVPRELRLAIAERVAADGDVLRPLDEASVRDAIGVLDAAGVDSVTIGYLHSYANPAHELRTAELIGEALPKLSITCSCVVCPEIREYERLSTATANAYVKPLMGRYLQSLEHRLKRMGIDAPVLLMTSGGGLTTLATAKEQPIRLVESGPAGGAILAAHLAVSMTLPDVLSFDMGGTTAKICLINEGAPVVSRAFEVDRTYRFRKGSGLPVRIPVIEMVEIGAGGGSIAHVDRLGRLQVGPDSAGSEPGPACYGRDGRRATVTDADVTMGRIDAEWFAGGALALDLGAAWQALDDDVAQPLGLDTTQAATAVARVVDENMAAAARAHASEWGTTSAGRTLIAFGGAAPLHACSLAQALDVERVVVPESAGVGSAVGFLLAPVSYEVVRSRYSRLSELQLTDVRRIVQALRSEAVAVVEQAFVQTERDTLNLQVDARAYMRYLGQGYEIAVDLPPIPDASNSEGSGLWRDELRTAFERAYEALYHRVIPDLDLEILSFSLAARTPPNAGVQCAMQLDGTPVRAASRNVDLVQGPAKVSAGVYPRDALNVGDRIQGPALIVEAQTTTVVAEGFCAVVQDNRSLLLVRARNG